MQTLRERNASSGAATAAPLDLHGGIFDPRALGGCQRWPEHLKLVNEQTGELIEGRCRATNLCAYCRTLFVVETVEMWSLSAVELAPTFWAVVTARNHLRRRDCYQHVYQLRQALRRRWPSVEWATSVEFQRRGALHLNLVGHGVPKGSVECAVRADWRVHERWRQRVAAPDCGACVACVVSRVWCSRPGVDAKAQGQWAGEIDDAEGAIRYVAKMLAHGLKSEQAPPHGWRGHRTSQSRGYLARPASVMREEARSALRVKRSLYKGLSLELALHAEENRDSYALYRERGKQPGRELELTPSMRRRAARARTPFVREYVAYLRDTTTAADAARLTAQRERRARRVKVVTPGADVTRPDATADP